jgi:SAM-dependent methyltransferase
MPASAWHYITPILSEVARLHAHRPIRSVLDIGVGAGKWGFLLRELLDFYHHGVYWREEWKTRIVGIEAFERYRNPLHDWAYDKVLYGDATALVDQVESVDLVIAMEVIEHLDKEAGLALLRKLESKASRGVILSFPPEYDGLGRHVLEQEATHGNPYEQHRSVWSEADLLGFQARKLADFTWFLERAVVRPPLVREEGAQSREGGVRVLTTPEGLLEYRLPDGTARVELVVLKHPWSGTLHATTPEGQLLLEEPLFSAQSYDHTLRLELPKGTTHLRLQVRPHPGSQGSEAWVKDFFLS